MNEAREKLIDVLANARYGRGGAACPDSIRDTLERELDALLARRGLLFAALGGQYVGGQIGDPPRTARWRFPVLSVEEN